MVAAVAAVLLLGLVVAAIVRWGWIAPASARGPSWAEPGSVARWAGERLAASGVPASAVVARVEDRTTQPRRVVVSDHPRGQDPVAIGRAVADLLLVAHRQGDGRRVDLAVVRQGDPAQARFFLPLRDAARLLADETEMRRLLAAAPPLPEPSDGAEPRPPVVAAPAGRESPATAAAAPPPGRDPEGASRAAPEPQTAAGPVEAPAARPVRVILRRGRRGLPHRAQPGETDVVVHSIRIGPQGRRPLMLRGLTVESRGTLVEYEDIAFVSLVRDLDGDARRGEGDRLLGEPDAFGDDDGSVDFTGLEVPFGADGRPIDILVVVDFEDPAVGGTLSLSIPEEGLLVEETAGEQALAALGLPLHGPELTLEGNVEPDPVQAELDRQAAEFGD